MLKIRATVKDSTIHEAGLGLFALDKIHKGQLIAEFDPKVDIQFNEEMLRIMPRNLQKYLMKYSYKSNGFYYLLSDYSRFMNHSLNPNCGQSKDKTQDVALRDIEAGEEIFCNYMEFDKEDSDRTQIEKGKY